MSVTWPAVRYASARRSVILGLGSFPVVAPVFGSEGYVVVGIAFLAVSQPVEDATGCAKCHTVLLRRVSPSPPRQTNPGT